MVTTPAADVNLPGLPGGGAKAQPPPGYNRRDGRGKIDVR